MYEIAGFEIYSYDVITRVVLRVIKRVAGTTRRVEGIVEVRKAIEKMNTPAPLVVDSAQQIALVEWIRKGA